MRKLLNERLLVTYAALVGITLLGLILVKELNISYPIRVTTTQASDLSVVGEGKVEVVPDQASLEAGILVANARTIEEAQSEINEKNNAIVEALKGLGVEENDIKTSNYSVNPNQDYSAGRTGGITGYNGNVTVSVTIRNIENVSQISQAVTTAGANQVYNVQYTVNNPEKFREEARNKAIENAKQQAEELARSLGIRLGKIVNVVESSPNGMGPIMPFERSLSMDAMGGANAPTMQPGTQEITSVVTLYFEKR
ncbi:MAG TPA: SIMPL domain-containing protein [Candidatus Levybacteria bacterium]|nr:SIMPL domain-containing protein [Candidatus Levybacteria bacterium]